MRVAVIGANGRTGRILVDRLVERGDTVFAGVRNPATYGAKNRPTERGFGERDRDFTKEPPRTKGLNEDRTRLTPFSADVAAESTIQLPPALDAIVFAASASQGWTLTNQSPKNVDFNGVRRIVDAADESTHIVLITSKGVEKSGFYAPRFFLNLLWGRVCHWKRQGELALREQHAGPATIVRPGYLERTTFDPETQIVYGQGDTFGVGAISRENLVDVVLEVLDVKPTTTKTNTTFEVIRRVPLGDDCTLLSDLVQTHD